jgi:hypothetical protein
VVEGDAVQVTDDAVLAFGKGNFSHTRHRF